MRQFFGFLLIVTSSYIIWILGDKIWQELNTAKAHQKQIEASIHLPKVDLQLPVTLIDGNGKVFSEEYVEWRKPTAIKDIPTIAQQIFIVSEDKVFYEHMGFNLAAITRALVANSSNESIQQGGSTITQQLVRMRYLSQEKTYERKLMELFYAYEVDVFSL